MKTIVQNHRTAVSAALCAAFAIAAAWTAAAQVSSHAEASGEAGGASAGNGVVITSPGGGTVAVQTAPSRSLTASGLAINAGPGPDYERVLRQVEAAMRKAMDKVVDKEAMEKALAEARRALEQARTGLGSRGAIQAWGPSAGRAMNLFSDRLHARQGPPEPALVLTAPVSPEIRGEWTEDLKVMDKLLRDGLGRVDAEQPRQAMGIRLFLWNEPQAQPIYLQDFGALFRYDTRMALAGAEKKTGKKDERSTSSTWENARRQISSSTYTNDGVGVTVTTDFYGGPHVAGYGADLAHQAPEYDSAKVEELVETALDTLVEAKNIRHLKPEECVTITFSGVDDTGAPARLTLRAAKRDIDQYANGKMKREEFRKKVARHVG